MISQHNESNFIKELASSILKFIYDKWFYLFGDIRNEPGLKIILQSKGDIDLVTLLFVNGNAPGFFKTYDSANELLALNFKLPMILSALKEDIDNIPDNGDYKLVYSTALRLYDEISKNKETFKKSFKNADLDNIHRMKDHLFGVAFYTYCGVALMDILAELSMHVATVKYQRVLTSNTKVAIFQEDKARQRVKELALNDSRNKLIKDVISFMKSDNFAKDLETGNSMQREALLNEDMVSIFGGIVLVTFIIKSLRLMIEVIYYSRSNLSQWLSLQATYLELNANMLESKRDPSDTKVIERQRILIEKLRSIGTYISVTNTKIDTAIAVSKETSATYDKKFQENRDADNYSSRYSSTMSNSADRFI